MKQEESKHSALAYVYVSCPTEISDISTYQLKIHMLILQLLCHWRQPQLRCQVAWLRTATPRLHISALEKGLYERMPMSVRCIHPLRTPISMWITEIQIKYGTMGPRIHNTSALRGSYSIIFNSCTKISFSLSLSYHELSKMRSASGEVFILNMLFIC